MLFSYNASCRQNYSLLFSFHKSRSTCLNSPACEQRPIFNIFMIPESVGTDHLSREANNISVIRWRCLNES